MTPVPESLGGTAIETVKRGWTTTGHPNPPQPRVIELRVHGVSGTPPESLLLSPKEFVYRCYGDGDSGFYRRRFRLRLNDAQAPGSDGDFDVDDNHEETEAFSWGGLTSGPSSRALWLLFFPFILINLAHWMLPPTRRPWFAAASVALLRLLGLTVTLTMLSTAVLLLVDLVGWQCSGMATCAAQLGPFKFLGTLTRGPATSVTALPIAVLVGTLLFIGRANPRLGDPPPDPAEAAPGASPLSRPTFWNADPSVTRLRHCHVAAWFAGLGALVLIAPVQTTTGAAQCGAAALVAVDVLILITTVGLTAWNGVTARGGDGFGNGATIATKTLRWIALITLLLALVLVACTDDTHRRLTGSPGPLPGLGLVIIGLFTAQVILLTLLLLGIWLSKAAPSTEPNRRPSLRGFTGWFVAAMAWLSAGGISIGAAIWLARFLGTPTVGAQAAVKDDAPIVLPAMRTRTARAVVGGVGRGRLRGRGGVP
jgi:hypothetical protein